MRGRAVGRRCLLGVRGLRIYFTDATGAEYRVHDVVFGVPPAAPHRRRLVPTGSQGATHRAFTAADGAVRLYAFGPRDRRAIEAELLDAQLRRAEFVGDRFEPAGHWTPHSTGALPSGAADGRSRGGDAPRPAPDGTVPPADMPPTDGWSDGALR